MTDGLEDLTKGKLLKPFMCLIKNIYHGHVDKSSADKQIGALRAAFPYYSEEILKGLVERFGAHLKKVGGLRARDEMAQWYHYFFYYKYSEEAEQINSPDLFHFVDKKYLLAILKNGFLYPSILTIDEYKTLARKYQGGIAVEKDKLINDNALLKEWNASAKKLREMISSGKKSQAINSYLNRSSFLPAVNCFTELPIKQIGLHADHYGSYGIRFSKEKIVIRDSFFSLPHQTHNHIRPIYYCDNSHSSLPWLILSRLTSDRSISDEEKKKLMIDLALLKPIDETLLSAKNIYSVIFEREWRYASFNSVFTFKRETIRKVLLSRTDYQRWLETRNDKIMEELVAYCNSKKISIELV